MKHRIINRFPAIHNNCRLYSLLLTFLGGLYCKQYRPTSVISLIRVYIFSYSGPSGILGSDRKQNTVEPVLGGVRIVALSISSHEQTQQNRVCCFLIL